MEPNNERGVALISAMLMMMLISSMLIGYTMLVVSDQRTRFIDRERTQAFYASHAALEKMTADLGDLFTVNYAPDSEDIVAIAAAHPTLPGVNFDGISGGESGYEVGYEDNDGDGSPDADTRQIASGPFQGFVGLVTPYTLMTTAQTASGAEVRLQRTLQTVAIPVFQFGIFSETDLSFFPGPNFNFGGRVHTNGNLFLATESTLNLGDKITAVGEVIRTNLSNGWDNNNNYNGTVNVATAPGTLRALDMDEGSLIGTLGSAENEPTWHNISIGTYNGYIRNGRTGAHRLDLPLVRDGASPIDIIRRPDPANPDTASVFGQRYFSMASLRILLSDTAADLTALPTAVGAPVSLELATYPNGSPIAASSGDTGEGYRTAAGTPLIGGFILINKQDTAGNWTDVTTEILNLGVSGRNLSDGTLDNPDDGTCAAEPNPDAVIRLQRVRDDPAGGGCGTGGQLGVATNYWPNVLYDPREGLRRDDEATGQDEVYLGGVMHYVELDVNNLRRWIEGTIGASGTDAMDVTGYVVYFSDRRNNRDAANNETGEYGWEDFVNTDADSTPNGALDVGEDLNANGTVEVYGDTPQLPYGFLAAGSDPLDNTVDVYSSRVDREVARVNRPVFFRRALKLVNGARGSLPANGLQGLTVVSEAPVYVQGDYNADAGGFGATGDGHVSAAVIADSVTLLSNAFNDILTFLSPHDPGGRDAETTWYRLGVIAGKGISFPRPGNNGGDHRDYGTDGGTHNFLRFIEGWGGETLNYRGSIVSLYTSRQAVGTYKCCTNVYGPPSRGYNFDVEFLDPNLLPPRTPMFRDVNTTGFNQIIAAPESTEP